MSTNGQELSLEERESRLTAAIKAGAKVPQDLAGDFVRAKLDMQRSILADSYGGLLGSDSMSQASMDAGDRYEEALKKLEEAIL